MKASAAYKNISDSVWLIAGVAALVRLTVIPLLNLLPEESYYWNYAQHLDYGYLDHPPMVAWLIAASDVIFGRSEFAVRLPAFLGWFAMAYFMYRLSAHTVGKQFGKAVVLMLAVLPIYFSVGFIMTPDAPLYVCWAGALFALERALVAGKKNAWYAAGIFFGLGLLSKYTMGLILVATLVYMIVDRDARLWFRRPQPYSAALIGTIIFLPVLIWNYQHDWVSFAFQGSRRWSGGIDFSFHILVGSILILLTPLGAYEAARLLIRRRTKTIVEQEGQAPVDRRTSLFLIMYSVVPLSIFVLHSLQGMPKLNWTGPVWLSLLPLISRVIVSTRTTANHAGHRKIATRWILTALVLVVFYAGGLTYLVAGTPGYTPKEGMPLPTAWKAFGHRVEEIEERIEDETGREPLIVGLDKYWISSEAAFYDSDEPGDIEILPEFGGQDLVGHNALMWHLWMHPDSARGRNTIMLSFARRDLDDTRFVRRFERVGEVHEEVLYACDREVGRFFWRPAYNYQGVD